MLKPPHGMSRRAVVGAVLMFVVAWPEFASRMHRPMAYYISKAAAVLIVDTRKAGPRGYTTAITVTEVLKPPRIESEQLNFLSTKSARC